MQTMQVLLGGLYPPKLMNFWRISECPPPLFRKIYCAFLGIYNFQGKLINFGVEWSLFGVQLWPCWLFSSRNSCCDSRKNAPQTLWNGVEPQWPADDERVDEVPRKYKNLVTRRSNNPWIESICGYWPRHVAMLQCYNYCSIICLPFEAYSQLWKKIDWFCFALIYFKVHFWVSGHQFGFIGDQSERMNPGGHQASSIEHESIKKNEN